MKRVETSFLQWCPVTEPESMGRETQEIPSEHQETILIMRVINQSLAQLAFISCAFSSLGDPQKPPGRGPGQPSLSGPA